jgi:hypothetical protein
MLLHVLGSAISARSLTVAFRFTRSTAIATGTEGNVFCALLVLVVAIVSSIHHGGNAAASAEVVVVDCCIGRGVVVVGNNQTGVLAGYVLYLRSFGHAIAKK